MKIRIGGVPEHFNYPWHYGIRKGYFQNKGIEIVWNDFPGGTGAMCEALKNNELDMAILLTEGAVKAIIQGANFKISKTFVDTPLIWGIHTSATNKKASLSNLASMNYAISRFGSGSHLMAHVHADESQIELIETQMKMVGNIDNARESLKNGDSDLIFWEKFMTKPFVDSGELIRLGCFPTPWPCFMIVTNNTFDNQNSDKICSLFEVLNTIILELNSSDFKRTEIASLYKLRQDDTDEWLKSTEWNCNFDLKGTSILNVCHTLKKLRLTDTIPPVNQLIQKSINLVI